MRSSGILLHISSLPNKYGIGTFGESAYEFVRFLEKAKQKYWQVLPLGPTSYGDSPYQTFSAFAGNPYFIDLDILAEEGLLKKEDYEHLATDDLDYVDFANIYYTRFDVLKIAFKNFDLEDKSFKRFLRKNKWLDNYALFMAIKNTQPEGNWQGWADEYKYRKKKAISEFKKSHLEDIMFWKFLQYEFFKQWNELKKYANDHGVSIIGDIPIYVAYDSCDVWANPTDWNVDKEFKPIEVAGCPPDNFALEGQLWGNPIYNYAKQEAEGYSWWIQRIEKSLELYDVVRIDHFRGFSGYYSIPATDKNAVNGVWKVGPGISLFNAIKEKLGDVNIIAEDLGFLTEDVHELLKATGYPGMKVLQFGFSIDDTEDSNEYAIHNLTKHTVTYTGTHDNPTTKGWFLSLPKEEQEYVLNYLGITEPYLVSDALIREAFKSVSDTVIIPYQDHLWLGDDARFNIPSTLGGNWIWRVRKEAFNDEMAERIAKLTQIYKR